MLLTVAQGMAFGTRKQGHEGVEPENESSHHQCKLTHHQNATSSSAATSVPSTLPKCQCQKRGNSHVAKSQEFVDEEDGGMNECSVSGTTVVSTGLDSHLVSGTSVLSAVPDSHCSLSLQMGMPWTFLGHPHSSQLLQEVRLSNST